MMQAQAQAQAVTWKLVLHHGPPQQDWRVGIQPHALIYTPHHIFELCVVPHRGLLSLSHDSVNLFLSLQVGGMTAIVTNLPAIPKFL